jgi:hypothetical protein
MARNDPRLLALLVRAVRDGMITEDAAVALLREADAPDLPRAPEEGAVRGLTDADVESGASLAARFLRQTHALTRAALVALRTYFRVRVRNLAADYGDGGALVAWQFGMMTLTSDQIVAAHLIGAQMTFPLALDAAARARLDPIYRRETAFLSRFADEIAVRDLAGHPFGTPEIVGRGELYEGSAYGAFWYAREGRADTTGYVAFYRARDDQGTCGPCADAAASGPYLPLDGPMPGSACIAGGRCRCERELVYDPAIYAQLTGGAA